MTQLVTMSEGTAEVLSDVAAHAAACGRLDCGHLGRKAKGHGVTPETARATRLAVFLYQCEGAGMTVDLNRFATEVQAIIGVLRTSQHSRPVYVRAGGRYARAVPGMSVVLPNAWAIRMTPQRVEVFGSLALGYSITETATLQHRTVETVKSHAGYLRRETGAHDAASALIALMLAGRLTVRGVTVPIEVRTPEPDSE